MRILLDTNVLLTGAFEPGSLASRLVNLRGRVTFIMPARVYSECKRVIARRITPVAEREAAIGYLDAFAARAGVLWVDDASQATHGRGESADERIIATAISLNCDVICTYNLRDFDEAGVRLATPMSLLRTESLEPPLDSCIQVPVLGSEGTLLVVGLFPHPSAIGDIASFGDESRIGVNPDGDFVGQGPAIMRLSTHGRIAPDLPVAIAMRYRSSGELEIICWDGVGDFMFNGASALPSRRLLASGKIAPGNQAKALLAFRPDHNFFCSTLGISGIPRFVPDTKLRYALRGGSLEALVGSSGLQAIKLLELTRTPTGEYLPRLRIPLMN